MNALNKDIKIWAPGLEILSVRVTKPSIPDSINENFKQMQKTKVNYFIAVEK